MLLELINKEEQGLEQVDDLPGACLHGTGGHSRSAERLVPQEDRGTAREE